MKATSPSWAGPTEATNKLWGILQKLQKEERAKGGVLDMDTDVVVNPDSMASAIICEECKDLEKIVGLQTDKPLKRAFMPFGGIKMAEEACRDLSLHPRSRAAQDLYRVPQDPQPGRIRRIHS